MINHQYLFPFVLITVGNYFNPVSADCPIAAVPVGGYVLSGCSTRTNSVCSIQCSSTGIVQSQICQPNGLWSGPQFNCYGGGNGVIPGGGGYGGNFNNNNNNNFGSTNFGQGFIGQGTCVSLSAPANGYYSGNCAPGIVGGNCIFSCRSGTELRGTSILTCLSSGTWSAGVPSCSVRTRWYVLVRRWFG